MATQNYNTLKNSSILIPATSSDLGTITQPYGNLYLAGNLTLGGNQATITATSTIVPKITSVTYPGSETAAIPAGGETITINGSGFLTGISVYVNGTILGSATVVSSAQVTFTSPALASGSYTLSVVNTDGGSANYVPGVSYATAPTWSTGAGTLGTSIGGSAISTINLSATDNAQTITYAITSGSLPSGLSLSSSGAITGTPATVSSSTTYNFTVGATDPQGQTVTRNFSYTINPTPKLAISYVVVAGGGGGGQSNGQLSSGGGAGGVLGSTICLCYSQLYTITVGGGGSGSWCHNKNGSNSVISGTGITTVTAIGGGGGGGFSRNYETHSGQNGGSGGGTSYPSCGGSVGLGTTGQGHNGGACGGGGGGANTAGSTRCGRYGGNGGCGTAAYSTQLSVVSLGDNVSGTRYIGGGGSAGGGTCSGEFPGTAGKGGGGGGGNSFGEGGGGGSGMVNTGGGGGGGNTTGTQCGGAGGSGLVLIYYPSTSPALTSTTGSPAVTVSGGYRYYAFTGSGSITP